MKIKALRQKHSAGCGPTSIKMAADYFGLKLSQKAVEIACGEWKKDGMSNKDLVDALEKIGLRAEAAHGMTWEDLAAKNTSENVIIVSWMLKGYIGHFSVVEKIDDKHIWLAEPESGKIVKMEKIVFLRLWFDYDDLWYPEKSSDFNLRWATVVSQKK